ncbi:TRAP dicarboxylate transporter, DctM subunit [Candidatus Vecturithrix granuli]|uniref:TRAP dicarboxylate transporter, DctM subunit n=1 Tax=Vecturithrix granuli TaxID=1499967 RepID=A0A081BWM9_VECG1|nr:TRAP dicarboxylate transporter, DctM subunit [Candidatus Vecturithrix granuli]
MITALLLFFLTLIVLTVPVAYALGLASTFWIWLTEAVPFILIPQRMYTGLDSFPLIAIPFFILAGKFMAVGGTSDRLIKVALVLVGRFRGGLAYVNIVASMFFAGITGSATADSSSIGGVLIPSMIKRGYDKDVTVAVTATSSTIGILIPPSIPMVIYGILMDQSIGRLFVAGALPGVLVGLILMAVTFLLARKRGYPKEPPYNFQESIKIFIEGILPMLTIVIVLGGIIWGIVTPTEAAVLAVFYAFFLGFFVYRSLTLAMLPRLLLETILLNGIVMLMVSAATIFSWIITSQQVPRLIGDFLMGMTQNRFILLFIFNLVLLVAGALLDLTPAMIIFIPVLAPLARYVGVDLIHFGVIVVTNLGIGLFTPPVGACLFVSCSIAEVNMSDILKGFIPYFVGMFIALMLITYFPELSLWLPSLMR